MRTKKRFRVFIHTEGGMNTETLTERQVRAIGSAAHDGYYYGYIGDTKPDVWAITAEVGDEMTTGNACIIRVKDGSIRKA
jgi:hypothetical protein